MPSFGPSSDNFGLPNWGSGHGGASLITLPFYIRWALQVTRLSQTNNYNKNKNKNRNKNKNKNKPKTTSETTLTQLLKHNQNQQQRPRSCLLHFPPLNKRLSQSFQGQPEATHHHFKDKHTFKASRKLLNHFTQWDTHANEEHILSTTL